MTQFEIDLMTFDKPNKNGRIYSIDMAPKIIERLKEQPLGPIDAPSLGVQLKDVSFRVIGSELVEDTLRVRIETLETSAGLELQDLLLADKDRSRSASFLQWFPSGIGRVDEEGRVNPDEYVFAGIGVSANTSNLTTTFYVDPKTWNPDRITLILNDVGDDTPPTDEGVKIARTRCGQYFVGYFESGKWFTRTQHLDGFAELPEGLEVATWANLG